MDNQRTFRYGVRSALGSGVMAVLLAFAALLAVPRAAFAAGNITVDRADDTAAASACTASASDCSLRGAFAFANANGGATINVPAGTYTLTLGELQIGTTSNHTSSIVGASAATTIIRQTTASSRVIDINPPGTNSNVVVSVSGVTITGGSSTDGFGGGGIIAGGPGNSLTMSNCVLDSNSIVSTSTPKGGGIEFSGGGVLTIDNCTFSNNTAGTSANNLGVGGAIDYFLGNLGGGAGQGGISITNSTFTNNTAGAVNSGAGGAVAIRIGTTQTPSPRIVTKNNFTGNRANAATNGFGGAMLLNSAWPITVQFNRIVGNIASGVGSGIYQPTGSGSVTDATENWWGCNAGPGNAGCDSVGGDTAGVTVAPRLVLSHTPAAATLLQGNSTTLTASFLTDSAGSAVSAANLSALIGKLIAFSGATRGTLSNIQTSVQSNGTATATFTAGTTAADCGVGGASAVFDNQSVPTSVTIQCLSDLTATLANNVSGSAQSGQSWTWTATIANGGSGAANYSTGQTMFSANLPNSANISYGVPTSSNPNVACSINGTNDLVCTASAALSLGAGTSFTVSFSATANALGSYAVPRTGGTCSADPNNLVTESNEANNACSNTVTVGKANTTTTIASDTPDPSVVGQSVTVNYSVAVNAPGTGTPTGNVTVSDGTASCTGTVAAGLCSITFTSAGAKTLTATYAGDSNFNGSTSASVAHQVNKADTTTTITSDTPDPSAPSQAVTVSYTVVANAPGAGTPTGNVTVSDGVDSCTGTVAAGSCSITLTTSGARTLVATYAGDSNFNGSNSAGIPHSVNAPTTTTTTITSDTPDPSVVGQSVTVSYSVTSSSGTPTGNVTVSDGTASCTGTVAAGSCSIIFTSVGAKTLTATYAGDSNFSGSTSAGVAHQVDKADTTTAITNDTPDPSVVGQAVTVNYSVAVNTPGAGTPTGNVTVSDGVDSCTGTVAAGSCSITFTSAGAKTLTATYAGDSNFNGSNSAGTLHTVNAPTTTTTITNDTPDPSVVGQSVTVSYSVTSSSGTPTGNVTVSDGTASCTGTVAAGSCSITFTSAGAKTLTATYAGDSNFSGSTSAGVAHQVDKADTTTAITNDTPDPSVVGQSVTVNYSVAVNAPGVGTPTGNVTVSDGTVSCTGTVAAGSCSITFTSAGAKTLTATYAGDSNFNGSNSAGVAHQVNKADTTTTITSDTPDPSTVGQAVTVSYTVVASSPGAGTPTGNVTVSDGTDSCTSTVAAGSCSITFSTAGPKTLTATYTGDSNFNGSVSANETHTVNIPLVLNLAVLKSHSGNFTQGQSGAQYTIAVSNVGTAAANDTVTVVDNLPSGLTATAMTGSGWNCTLSTLTCDRSDALAAGTSYPNITLTVDVAANAPASVTNSASVSISGDGNTADNTSNDPTTIDPAAKINTTITITSDTPDPSTVGQAVIVSYTVVPASGSSTPTGNVTVSDGVDSCTGTVAAGQCSITLTTVGARTLTATYAGDSSYNGSTSSGVPHTVNPSVTPTPTCNGQTATIYVKNGKIVGGPDNGKTYAGKLEGSKNADVIVGTDGNDIIEGNNGNDVICGLGGNDTLRGNNGDDYIDGGSGNDKVDGGNGNDTLFGSEGDDTVEGNDGNDILNGGNGKDRLEGGYGNDTLTGGAGPDRFSGGPGTDTATDFNRSEGDVKDSIP